MQGTLPQRINADQAHVEQGLAKLVLTLIELVRRLLEKQAIRRIEAGSLSDEQIERMGETFIKLERKMAELKLAFGLQDEDLNLNLGPLGDLM
ncbi:MAG: gas vesicle protein K [Chloroflexi bacterium]|nr:gas vesicle protein K [Chloroflexota bacterium]